MPPASVTILMATFNGAGRLRAQLDSFAAQSLAVSRLVVSDDGSADDTRRVLSDWALAHPGIAVELLEGPQRGASQNFLSLLRRPTRADLVALSDQDDVWLPEKLQVAAAALGEGPAGTAALYCGRTLEVDEDLAHPRLSRGAPRPPAFAHALVQNIAGGNTMVLNRAAAEVIRQAALLTGDVVIHDWWIYQVITGTGGRVIFDDRPHMLYRQHAGNVIGANRGAVATLRRAQMLMSGRFSVWCRRNIAALRRIEDRLTPENRALLDAFETARSLPPLQSLAAIRRAGLYRQGLRGQISLYAGALLRRL